MFLLLLLPQPRSRSPIPDSRNPSAVLGAHCDATLPGTPSPGCPYWNASHLPTSATLEEAAPTPPAHTSWKIFAKKQQPGCSCTALLASDTTVWDSREFDPVFVSPLSNIVHGMSGLAKKVCLEVNCRGRLNQHPGWSGGWSSSCFAFHLASCSRTWEGSKRWLMCLRSCRPLGRLRCSCCSRR